MLLDGSTASHFPELYDPAGLWEVHVDTIGQVGPGGGGGGGGAYSVGNLRICANLQIFKADFQGPQANLFSRILQAMKLWGPRGGFRDLRPGAILRATARPRQFKKTTCDLCCFNFLMKKSDLVTWGLEKQWPCDLRGGPLLGLNYVSKFKAFQDFQCLAETLYELYRRLWGSN